VHVSRTLARGKRVALGLPAARRGRSPPAIAGRGGDSQSAGQPAGAAATPALRAPSPSPARARVRSRPRAFAPIRSLVAPAAPLLVTPAGAIHLTFHAPRRCLFNHVATFLGGQARRGDFSAPSSSNFGISLLFAPGSSCSAAPRYGSRRHPLDVSRAAQTRGRQRRRNWWRPSSGTRANMRKGYFARAYKRHLTPS
jgi:hypothetical protein